MRNFAVCALALLAACSSKPSDDEIRTVLTENLPSSLKAAVAVDQLQSETSGASDDTNVKFKAVVKTTEPLFVAAAFDETVAAAGGKPDLAEQVLKASQQLSAPGQEKFRTEIAQATARPVFLKIATPAGTTSEWYGSFRTKKVVDKWMASDFKTDVDVKLPGQPKAAFSSGSVEIAAAKAWVTDMQSKQDTLLQRITDAKALEDKDAELVNQRAETQRERQEKESVIAAQEKQARKLPLQVRFHRALLGNSLVMQIQSMKPMTVRLEVARGLQRFAKDLQLVPGREMNIGHVEGWGFAAGDQVKLTNPSFDPASFVVN